MGFYIFGKCGIIHVMKLKKKIDRALVLVVIFTVMILFGCLMKTHSASTYAEGDEMFAISEAKFVTFYDAGEKLTVKTDAATVRDAIERAGIIVNDGDRVEPTLDAEISADNFFINIYRARPVIVRDGVVEKYLMTASFDTKTIANEAGVAIYDGDEVEMVHNTSFLEVGVANIYEVTRNGGRTVTVEEEIPFAERTEKDFNLPSGVSEVRQLGEVGTKVVSYNVLYVDGKEVSREMVSEEVVRAPVDRVVAVGAKKSIPPEWETCAGWARQAGVSESDLSNALDLIYRESGCRVDAENASSGAYGIPQALPGSKMAAYGADWASNPVTQIRWMIGYVNGRYGGWSQALQFWYAHGWY